MKDARELSESLQKDIVLRSDRVSPPIVKIMSYRKDLMKKIL